MARDFSASFKRNLTAISPDEPLLFLIEITHPQLTQPIRLARDSKDYIYSGETYIAMNFDIVLTNDEDKTAPKASLIIANIRREIVNWIEQSEGGLGAGVKILLLQRSNTLAELELNTKVQTIAVTPQQITAELGFDNILDKSFVQIRYDEFDAPGLI